MTEKYYLNDVLKNTREELGYNQRQFAIKLGVTAQFINRIENHHSTLKFSTLQEFMSKLGFIITVKISKLEQ